MTKEKEFVLGEKISNDIFRIRGMEATLKVSDVKEFIRRRDALDRLYMLGEITRQEHADKCDKLAGEELSK